MDVFQELAKTLDKMILVQVPTQVEKWANRVIEDLSKKILEMTPKDTGNLREAMVVKKWNGKYAELYFNGDYKDLNGTQVKLYAYYQHENLFVNYTTPGTRSKFVEIPFKNNKALYDRWFDQMVGGVIKW
jgi:hypothetical protein